MHWDPQTSETDWAKLLTEEDRPTVSWNKLATKTLEGFIKSLTPYGEDADALAEKYMAAVGPYVSIIPDGPYREALGELAGDAEPRVGLMFPWDDSLYEYSVTTPKQLREAVTGHVSAGTAKKIYEHMTMAQAHELHIVTDTPTDYGWLNDDPDDQEAYADVLIVAGPDLADLPHKTPEEGLTSSYVEV